jgi:hypothetical protein
LPGIFGLPVPISYSASTLRALLVLGGTGAHTYNVLSTPLNSSYLGTYLNAGAGNDIINVGSSTNPSASTLDPVQGTLNIDGQGGDNTLNINDQGSTVKHTYSDLPGRFARTNPGSLTINYTHVEHPHFNPGASNDTAPMVVGLIFPTSVRAGRFATLRGRLLDPDKDDKLTLTVGWGDGSKPAHFSPNRAPFRLKHTYKRPGQYTAHVTWADNTGLSNSRDLNLVVTPRHMPAWLRAARHRS